MTKIYCVSHKRSDLHMGQVSKWHFLFLTVMLPSYRCCKMLFPNFNTTFDFIFKEVSKQGTTVEKLKSGLPKFDKEIQECEVILVLCLTSCFSLHLEVTHFVTCCLKKKISDIEQRVTAVESEMTKFIDEAESLKTEQQHIVAELEERKKTVKDKQVYWKGFSIYVSL